MTHVDPIARLRIAGEKTRAGFGGAAILNVGTAAGTVAAGDDSRFTSGSGGGTPGTNVPYMYPFGDAITDNVNDNFTGGAIDTTGTRFSGASAWTVDNAGGTYTYSGGKLWLISPSSASLQIRGMYLAVPSGNWCIRAQCSFRGGSTEQRKVGMYLRDSSSGKLEAFGIGFSGGGSIYWASKWTNSTTYSATRATQAVANQFFLASFLEIEYDGTNYYYRASYADGGAHTVILAAFAKTNFLSAAADGIGLFSMNDSSVATTLVCSGFYRVTASTTL